MSGIADPRAGESPAAGRGAPLRVRLAGFEGAIDMLLHLIRTGELDVTGLPVAEVARQFGEDLAGGGPIDPESGGDNAVGVATLIHLKSRHLLPADPLALAEAPADGAGPDDADRARRTAVLRELAEHLQTREAVMELVYQRPAASVAPFAGEEGIDADLFALLRAFREILLRVGKTEPASLSRERMTLVERIHWLMETLERERRVQFRALFQGLDDRVACILTFLALLEVIRLRLVRAHVSHHHEDILILLADEPITPDDPAAADHE